MVHIYSSKGGFAKAYQGGVDLTAIKKLKKKCFLCSKIHNEDTIYCENCISIESKEIKLPSVFTKGNGFTIGSMVGSTATKVDTDKETGVRVNRKKFSFKEYD